MLKPRKRLVKAKLKEDKLLTFTAKSQDFFKSYGNYFTYGIIAVLVIIIGISLLNKSKQSAASAANFEELLARDAYMKGESEDALTRANRVIEEFPGTSSAASALMVKGRIYQTRGDYSLAEAAYKDLVKHHSNDQYMAYGALYALGSIEYGRGQYEQAARYYQDAAKRYPNHFNAPEALLEAGKCLEKISKYEDAKRIYQTILKTYPKSRSADKARDNFAELEFM